MRSKWRRFEILFPLQFNDGREVPADRHAEAILEIVDHFVLPDMRHRKLRVIGVIY